MYQPTQAELLALAAWAQRKKAENIRDSGAAAIANYTGEIKRLPAGVAYGSGEMQRHRAGALPMQYFRHGGGC